MTQAQQDVYDAFNAMGGVAHFYPRLKAVSINGFPRIPLQAAITKMQSALDAKKQRAL